MSSGLPEPPPDSAATGAGPGRANRAETQKQVIMSHSTTTLAAERLAALWRAARLLPAASTEQRKAIEDHCRGALRGLKESQRAEILETLAALNASRGCGGAGQAVRQTGRADGPTASASTGAAQGGDERGALAELMRQRASLELKLQTESDRVRLLETQIAELEQTHREAQESLSLQQRKIRELQEERARLLAELSQLDARLRVQINETEQVTLQYEKLKASRQLAGQQVTEQAEQINALRAEIERLKAELERTRQERDAQVASVSAAASRAEAATAEAVFAALWETMHKELPEVFVPSHVPTRATFGQLCEALIEFLRVFITLEAHVHQLLRDLRQVSEQGDKLNHFYIMFTKNPRLVEVLREFLVTGRRKGNFVNLLRAHQAWARAFATGLNKVIIRAPALIDEELNYRRWPLQKGFTVTEEVAIGRYFRDVAAKAIPEKLGTAFRKHAADMAYEDYDHLMRTR
jgi:uncharacterized small protein (DUF1192 family)